MWKARPLDIGGKKFTHYGFFPSYPPTFIIIQVNGRLFPVLTVKVIWNCMKKKSQTHFVILQRKPFKAIGRGRSSGNTLPCTPINEMILPSRDFGGFNLFIECVELVACNEQIHCQEMYHFSPAIRRDSPLARPLPQCKNTPLYSLLTSSANHRGLPVTNEKPTPFYQ